MNIEFNDIGIITGDYSVEDAAELIAEVRQYMNESHSRFAQIIGVKPDTLRKAEKKGGCVDSLRVLLKINEAFAKLQIQIKVSSDG